VAVLFSHENEQDGPVGAVDKYILAVMVVSGYQVGVAVVE
jgi:hypothetical protein